MEQTTEEKVIAERLSHIVKHGKTIMFDLENNSERQLSIGAALIAARDEFTDSFGEPILYTPKGWNQEQYQKMLDKPYRERVVIAASLLLAEIDRLDHPDTHLSISDFYPSDGIGECEALLIEAGAEIDKGVITLPEKELFPEHIKAIIYLLDEWDYACEDFVRIVIDLEGEAHED